MSSAVELALQSVLQRPTEPVMLDKPIDIGQLPTPALVLDRATMSNNIRAMSEHLGSHGKGFRPHAKTHKCPEIARQQMAAGAVGICTAKVSEAAVMVHAGIDRVLVTSPVSTAAKARVINHMLTPDITLLLVVDSSAGLAALAGEIDDEGVLVQDRYGGDARPLSCAPLFV